MKIMVLLLLFAMVMTIYFVVITDKTVKYKQERITSKRKQKKVSSRMVEKSITPSKSPTACFDFDNVPIHPSNDKHNFSGYVKKVYWHTTRDNQLQCWLTVIGDDRQKVVLNKYIKMESKGLVNLYRSIQVADYVHCKYTRKSKYYDIGEIKILRKVKM